MFRVTRLWCSTALHNSTPFVDGALQLVKLHLAHRNAREDNNKEACQAIEREFLREVEVFRPCFTMSASLEVAQQYSKKLYSALKYFGMDDDPLIRQLDSLLGRREMQDGRRRQQQRSFFKAAGGASLGQSSAGSLSTLAELVETTLPTELPHAPRVDLTSPRRPGAVQIQHRYRGHWVLQEPDIAITRDERKEDPW
ncbi:putative mitochondrial hypothetical protein [Leptomonas pyrrhocoris]|uniref:Uncharacterized protein n=1 Tax=Leptomonas pyrrhocoris TaxID=157538 RepID=A0A0N0DXK1_LEPPY|nr:putative mitochondrial hypothetical protein [Leptomonas pyrrhocoris]XP_015661490.1 putative mitochondrial hypothetical protein [Leptomonas pyrrhocoris]KPA83050.1 putative mitochondrial hypothetical protein [Leptomonas pyrrhocoris]KPA83051.1 putative mitochondrial hypothetical protein [Leptomonas pyrrhocoris]|eukprot:XP_015661489.1 putative mitochondrial hypothetical protein [Leptomonas pyrrhocoris]